MDDNNKRISIKSWAEEDRPREKMLKRGSTSLSDSELLAILISSGNAEESAVELAKRILTKAGNNLSQLSKFSVADFVKQFKGIGPAKAVTIVAALELGKRRSQQEVVVQPKITSSRDVYNYFLPQLCDIKHEETWALLLDRANKVIKKFQVSKGGISATVVDMRIILKEAIDNSASGIILCHNHPSGNTTPSAEDNAITSKLKQASTYMDMVLLDHIIVSEGSYYSYSDEGAL